MLYSDCMSALAINLGIVLATGIIVNGTVNVFLPYVRAIPSISMFMLFRCMLINLICLVCSTHSAIERRAS